MTMPQFAADERFMKEALAQAKDAQDSDEVPVGAVITFKNQIIARAHNQVEMLKDPTAHAEMIAITQATNHLSCKWLSECCLYVTIEPCSMCAGALVLSRIKRLVFAAEDPKTGACGTLMNIAQHSGLNHKISIQQGILEPECSQIMKDYFRKKR